jgi:hypothetical protein
MQFVLLKKGENLMPDNNTIEGIKACVFDAYGTLFDVHSAVGKHRHRLGDIADQVSNLKSGLKKLYFSHPTRGMPLVHPLLDSRWHG